MYMANDKLFQQVWNCGTVPNMADDNSYVITYFLMCSRSRASRAMNEFSSSLRDGSDNLRFPLAHITCGKCPLSVKKAVNIQI